MNKEELKFGFIGCGKMASAIIKGLISSKFIKAENIIGSAISKEHADLKEKTLGIKMFVDNIETAKQADIIFICVKPSQVRDVLFEINGVLSKEKLVVSIAAGVKIDVIEDIIHGVPVIRVMPNAGLLLSEGMCGVTKGTCTTEEQMNFVVDLFSHLGKSLSVTEDKMDIVTAISGSGPAFFYKTIHEIALAGEKLGLDYEKSLLLAAQTAIGSAKIMMTSDLTPEELINNISTKGGCTEVGVSVMNEENTEKLFEEIIRKTKEKAEALGKWHK